MKVGDLVAYKPSIPGDVHRGAGIVTWVEDTDSVTYPVVVDWGNGGRQVISYMIEVIDESR